MSAKVLNYGSLNIDRVYRVKDIVKEGETISAYELNLFPGGKGLNQSIALAKAGAEVYQAGGVGEDGQMLLDSLTDAGVNIDYVRKRDSLTGHAVIQVDHEGRNCIIIIPGANHGNNVKEIRETLSAFEPGDLVLLQNEIDNNETIMREASSRNLKIVINPSPMDSAVLELPLELVDIFLLNEHEAHALITARQPRKAVSKNHPRKMLRVLQDLFPRAMFVLTLGSQGSMCVEPQGEIHEQAIFPTKVVDTTAAGDTFTGFFLSAYLAGKDISEALKRASLASSISVSRAGAAPSIPTLEELEEKLKAI